MKRLLVALLFVYSGAFAQSIDSVETTATPNEGRVIWNANDYLIVDSLAAHQTQIGILSDTANAHATQIAAAGTPYTAQQVFDSAGSISDTIDGAWTFAAAARFEEALTAEDTTYLGVLVLDNRAAATGGGRIDVNAHGGTPIIFTWRTAGTYASKTAISSNDDIFNMTNHAKLTNTDGAVMSRFMFLGGTLDVDSMDVKFQVDVMNSAGSYDTLTFWEDTLAAAYFKGDGGSVTGLGAANMADGSVSDAEFRWLDGVDAAVMDKGDSALYATQTDVAGFLTGSDTTSLSDRINLKAPIEDPTFTGTLTAPTGLNGTARLSSGVLSGTPSDTIGLAAALAAASVTITADAIIDSLNTVEPVLITKRWNFADSISINILVAADGEDRWIAVQDSMNSAGTGYIEADALTYLMEVGDFPDTAGIADGWELTYDGEGGFEWTVDAGGAAGDSSWMSVTTDTLMAVGGDTIHVVDTLISHGEGMIYADGIAGVGTFVENIAADNDLLVQHGLDTVKGVVAGDGITFTAGTGTDPDTLEAGAADTTSLSDRIDLRALITDTTAVRTYSNSIYALITDTTAVRTYSNSIYALITDTTAVRTYSSSIYMQSLADAALWADTTGIADGWEFSYDGEGGYEWTSDAGAAGGKDDSAASLAGTGIEIYSTETNDEILLKRLVAGYGTLVEDSTDSVMIRTDTSVIAMDDELWVFEDADSGEVLMVNSDTSVTGVYMMGMDTTNASVADSDAWMLTVEGGEVVLATVPTGGSGEINTASNLGGGLANYDGKVTYDLQFNTFAAADFDLGSNLITIDGTKWALISDTTAVRTYSNSIYALITDTTAVRTYSNSIYALITDTTAVRTYSSSIYALITDTTAVRTYSSSIYAPKADPAFTGVVAADTIVVADSLYAAKVTSGEFAGNGNKLTSLTAPNMADGSISDAEFQYLDGVSEDIPTTFATFALITDTTAIRTYSNSIYALITDTTAVRTYSNSIYALITDTTAVRAYSNSIYALITDTTAVRTYSNSIYALITDTTAVRTYSNSIYLQSVGGDALWPETTAVADGWQFTYDGEGGYEWVANGSAGADGQDADSIMAIPVDTAGRAVDGQLTAMIYDADTVKYKHYWMARFDTAGFAEADSDAFMLSVADGQVVVAGIDPSDTIGMGAANAALFALISDTTAVRTYSNSIYALITDTTAVRTYSNSIYALITDTTAVRTYSSSIYAPKASPTFTGTVTMPTGLTGRPYLTSGVLSVEASDTTGMGAANAALFALISDTTAVRTYSNSIYALITDTTAVRTYSNSIYAGKTFAVGFTMKDTVLATEVCWSWKVPQNITIVEIAGFTNANTTTFNVEERAEATPNTAGDDAMASDLVADNDQQEQTSFDNAGFAANTWMTVVTSATGDVETFTVTIRYTID